MMMWPVILMPIILVGLLLPFMAQTRRGILFGVTAPVDFAESSEGRAAVRRYRVEIALLVSACLGMALAGRATGHVVPGVLGVPLELVVGFALWHMGAGRVSAHRVVVPLERSTELHADGEGVLASALTFLSLAPLGLAAVWVHAHAERAPERIPIHWNAEGVANGFVSRDHGGVYLPLVMGAAIVLLVVALGAFLRFVPGTQKKLIAVMQTTLAVVAWLMVALFIGIAVLPLVGAAVHPAVLGVMIVCEVMGVIAVTVWMVVKLRAMGDNRHDGTPDSMWHAGLFYYNPADAAVLVPKRFGWGWTLNFARPIAWVYVAAVLLVVVMVLLPRLMR